MNEPPKQPLQWIAASRRPLSFIVGLVPLSEKCLARAEGASGFLQSQPEASRRWRCYSLLTYRSGYARRSRLASVPGDPSKVYLLFPDRPLASRDRRHSRCM